MREFNHLKSLEETEQFITQHPYTFIYISSPTCSVCHGLKPQVQELMNNYPEIKIAHIDTQEVPEIAGRFSIFTVPVLLFIVEGKEYLREARIVHMDLLEEKLDRIYKNMVEPH
ncbi:thioredoxin family protein [Virgibacillus sp. SK37]|uniref:thioredoxin family protein n=1 Tax=Virgibacillus sp. SK37 TaxID=403957 RepID=UPI0004D189B1|nr:thioredoxin family protein [Virgibacillus sp. SK37]AIF42270.1 thioredoxin [Virgibacillus sp. SK37]